MGFENPAVRLVPRGIHHAAGINAVGQFDGNVTLGQCLRRAGALKFDGEDRDENDALIG